MICATCNQETNYTVEAWHCNCLVGHHVLVEFPYCPRCETHRPGSEPASDPTEGSATLPALNDVTLPANLSFEEWEAIGQRLRHIEKNRLWWWGDWLLYGETHFPDRYSQALEASDYTIGVLRNAMSVAKTFPASCRHDVPWSYHESVAHLPPDERELLLNRAEEKGYTREMLREAVKMTKQIKAGIDPFVELNALIDKLIRFLATMDDKENATAHAIRRLN